MVNSCQSMRKLKLTELETNMLKDGFKSSELYTYGIVIVAGLYEFLVSSHTGVSASDISPVQILSELTKAGISDKVDVNTIMAINEQMGKSITNLSNADSSGTTGVIIATAAAALYNIKRTFLKYQDLKMQVERCNVKQDNVKHDSDIKIKVVNDAIVDDTATSHKV